MLEKDANKRIGNKNKEEIKQDPFFKGIDWDKVLRCEYSPPITDFSGLQDEDEYEDEAGYRGRVIILYIFIREYSRTRITMKIMLKSIE